MKIKYRFLKKGETISPVSLPDNCLLIGQDIEVAQYRGIEHPIVINSDLSEEYTKAQKGELPPGEYPLYRGEFAKFDARIIVVSELDKEKGNG